MCAQNYKENKMYIKKYIQVDTWQYMMVNMFVYLLMCNIKSMFSCYLRHLFPHSHYSTQMLLKIKSVCSFTFTGII
jgi:hypothetical protein